MSIKNLMFKSIASRNVKWVTFCNPIQKTELVRNCSAQLKEDNHRSQKFETVFSFPFVRHVATLNKLKLYHIFGTTLALPSFGLLETLNFFPQYSFLAAAYIGVTGGILFSLASLPFKNAIGFIYISEDNKLIKISSVDFWGRRIDKIVAADDWVPLLDLKPKTMDAIYLTPQLTDGTKYKLFVKFGKVLNSRKMGQVIE